MRAVISRIFAAVAMSTTPALAAEGVTAGVQADAPPCAVQSRETVSVAKAVDGDTLVLEDGRIVRLAGIEAPKPFLARPDKAVGDLAEKARRELERLALGKTVELRLGTLQRDRHNRILAQVYLGSTWLQEAMVTAGLARVRPLDEDFSCLGVLVTVEREIRESRKGLWANPEFAVISAYDPSLIERKGLYVLVEGRVISVGHGDRVDFLNFGRNWQRDFTVMISGAAAASFGESGLSVDSLAEKRIRVRGVIEEGGGPILRLNSPGEIEVLGDD
jgi:endonuclease YncB( thermonuclease family)